MITSLARPSWLRPQVMLAIALGLVMAAAATWFLRNQSMNQLNRTTLLSLRLGLELGQTSEVVRAKVRATSNAALRLHENSPTGWFVRMPLEWGGSDWLLRIEFKDGKVSAIRVRNSDGEQPVGSPPDKVTSPQPGMPLESKPVVIKVTLPLLSC